MPVPPPVTTATRPLRSNRSLPTSPGVSITRLPDSPQQGALAPDAKLLLAFGRRDERCVLRQLLPHFDDLHLRDARLGEVARMVEAHLEDAPRKIGLVEPVGDTRIASGNDRTQL